MDIIFKALADKQRRQIIALLKKKSMSVSELLQHFQITQASLSHHLDALKKANLVTPERRGQFIYYSLNISVMEDITNNIFNLFNINK